jgi:hypothetical protein
VNAIDEAGGVVLHNAPGIPMFYGGLLLAEIASPVSFARGTPSSGASFNLGKWALYNMWFITLLDTKNPGRVLVAPSDQWTRGYGMKVRQHMAKATGMNHDLREAATMLFFHSIYPQPWVSLTTYIERL